jgi:hypothetical protein
MLYLDQFGSYDAAAALRDGRDWEDQTQGYHLSDNGLMAHVWQGALTHNINKEVLIFLLGPTEDQMLKVDQWHAEDYYDEDFLRLLEIATATKEWAVLRMAMIQGVVLPWRHVPNTPFLVYLKGLGSKAVKEYYAKGTGHEWLQFIWPYAEGEEHGEIIYDWGVDKIGEGYFMKG